MGNVRDVKLNLKGVLEALNDDGVVADCMRRAEATAESANDSLPEHGYTRADAFDYEESKTENGNRCAVVYTRTDLAKAMQAKHSTLTDALDAGRR